MKIDTAHAFPPQDIQRPNPHTQSLVHTTTIQHEWRGRKLSRSREIRIRLTLQKNSLLLEWRAPNLNNQSPRKTPGALWKLWEHDVVEMFFAGTDEKYLEVEFGPHGHYLGLQMNGVRSPVTKLLPIPFSLTEKNDAWWSGRASIPLSFLPRPVLTWNAYAIYTEDGLRRYCALEPGEGPPDFHQLSCFQPLPFPIE